MRSSSRILAAYCVSQLVVSSAFAQDNSAWVDEGRQLLADNKCNGSCHQSYAADNDPLSLYTRADRKAVDRENLERYVRLCVSKVGSMVFPDDFPKMSAALNVDFYKFK